MLLKLITELNEILAHRFHSVSTDETHLHRLMTRRNNILGQILLFLAKGEPTQIQVVP